MPHRELMTMIDPCNRKLLSMSMTRRQPMSSASFLGHEFSVQTRMDTHWLVISSYI
jgi:hypothetical protein